MWRAERLRVLLRRSPGGQVCESARPLQVDEEEKALEVDASLFGSQTRFVHSDRGSRWLIDPSGNEEPISPLIEELSSISSDMQRVPPSSHSFSKLDAAVTFFTAVNRFAYGLDHGVAESSSCLNIRDSLVKGAKAGPAISPSIVPEPASSSVDNLEEIQLLSSAYTSPDISGMTNASRLFPSLRSSTASYPALPRGTSMLPREILRQGSFQGTLQRQGSIQPSAPLNYTALFTNELPKGKKIDLTNIKDEVKTLAPAAPASHAATVVPPVPVDFYLSLDSEEGSPPSSHSNKIAEEDLPKSSSRLDVRSLDATSPSPSPWPVDPQPPSADEIAALDPVAKWLNDTAAESDFSLAEYFHSNQQYGAMAWQLYEAASKGKVKAMYNLGVCYALGRGVRRNDLKAMEYFHQAALKDHPTSMYTYSHRRLENESLPVRERTSAARMMLTAAEKGEYDAMMFTALDLGFRGPEESKMISLFDTREDADAKALDLLRKVVARCDCNVAKNLLKELEERFSVLDSGYAASL